MSVHVLMDARDVPPDLARFFETATVERGTTWNIATEPTPFAHFATFPQALVERCIRAGTSEHGACVSCGSPWRRIVEKELHATRGKVGGPPDRDGLIRNADLEMTGGVYGRYEVTTLGWEPSCQHSWTRPVIPCRVLDPFMGSGTTALVARRLGRHAIGIELNAEYLAIAAKRLQQLSLLA